MSLSSSESFVDLEIRIFPKREQGYPVYIKLGDGRDFERGFLASDVLPWVLSGDPATDGQRLFDTLFADPRLRSAWDVTCGKSPQRRIRLRIDADAPELHALPWELLRDGDVLLSADASTPFSRYLPVAEPWGDPVTERPIRVLAVIANPDDLDLYNLAPLNVAAERALLKDAFGDLPASQVQLTFLDAPVTLERLERELSQGTHSTPGYHVLHFVGHGAFSERREQAALYLQDEDGNTRVVTDDDFIAMLKRQPMRPRLVFLAACQSATRSTADAFAGLGPKLSQAGVPAVVTMQDVIAIQTTHKMTAVFYQHLMNHGTVDITLNTARSILLTTKRADAAVPVLFMRLKDGKVWVSQVEADSMQQETSFISKLTQNLNQILLSDSDAQRDLRNRRDMLEQVKRFWIKGVLERSLHGAAMLELGMKERADAVERPWDMVVQAPERPTESLPRGAKIMDVFDEMNGKLLILGKPGSGKTTMLLELARETIARAEQDPTQPIPVVFNLSSWVEERKPFAEWLVDELGEKYRVPHKIATPWVEAGQILPLLDGLDEVRGEHREACVKAINAFRDEHWVRMAVCSRTAEYKALETQLDLEDAIVLQPLGPGQIDDYLDSAGGELDAARKALREDAGLRELARSPLMLSIMALAYRGLDVKALPQLDSPQDWRQHLFDTYVQRMFKRFARTDPGLHTREQIQHWLSWLARAMLTQGQTVFFIERMQPNWLSPRAQRRYRLGVRLIYGLYWTLAFVNIFGPSYGQANQPYGWMGTLLGGLAFGLIAGLALGVARGALFGPVLGLALGVGGVLCFSTEWGLRWAFATGLVCGSLTGFAVTLAFRIAPGKIPKVNEIKLVEALIWSSLLSGTIWGAFWGLISGLIGRLLFGPIPGASFGIFVGIVVLLAKSVTSSEVETKTYPNQGIRQSALNATLVALIAGLPFGLFFGTSGDPLIVNLPFEFGFITVGRNPIQGWAWGLSLGMAFGLFFGWFSCIQHFVLRLILTRNNCIPWRYARFLDYAAERIFMRKVGGGYIFVHRLLQEYFASLGDAG